MCLGQRTLVKAPYRAVRDEEAKTPSDHRHSKARTPIRDYKRGEAEHKANVWTTELVFVIGLLTTKASLFLWMLAPGKGFPSSTVTCCRGMQYSFSTELQTVFYVRLFARHIECAGAKKLVCTANSFFFLKERLTSQPFRIQTRVLRLRDTCI